jgi:hypothetical protein
MKKVLLTALAVFAFTFANAQEEEVPVFKSKRGENFLPQAGDWAIGFNADGLFNYVGNAFNSSSNSAPSVDFQRAGTFVGKKFITDNTAYRVVANFKFDVETQGDDSSTSLDLQAGLGKEWRRGKTRLQGFYGADALFNFGVSSSEVNGVETKNPVNFGASLNGFIGAEYFIFPKMSIGAQYTYGVGVSFTAKEDGGDDSKFAANIGGVGVSSINLTLHF